MKTKSKKPSPKPVETVDTAPKLQTGPFISESALRQLQQLYGKAQTQNAASTFPDSIGTLPAVAMDDVIRSQSDSRKKNFLPNTVREPEPRTEAEKSKITAELMDVDFD